VAVTRCGSSGGWGTGSPRQIAVTGRCVRLATHTDATANGASGENRDAGVHVFAKLGARVGAQEHPSLAGVKVPPILDRARVVGLPNQNEVRRLIVDIVHYGNSKGINDLTRGCSRNAEGA